MNKQRNIVILGLLVLFTLIGIYYHIDQNRKSRGEVIAWLTLKTGKVTSRHEDISLWKDIDIKHEFYDRDILSTAASSKAEIEFVNGRRLIVEEKSQVIITLKKTKVSQTLHLILSSGFIRTVIGNNVTDGIKEMRIKVGDYTYVLNAGSEIELEKRGKEIGFTLLRGNVLVINNISNKRKIVRKTTDDQSMDTILSDSTEQEKNISLSLDYPLKAHKIWIYKNDLDYRLNTLNFRISSSSVIDSKKQQVIMKIDGLRDRWFIAKPTLKDSKYAISVNMMKILAIAKKAYKNGLLEYSIKIKLGVKSIADNQSQFFDNEHSLLIGTLFELPDDKFINLEGSYLSSSSNIFLNKNFFISPQIIRGRESVILYGKKNILQMIEQFSFEKGFKLSLVDEFFEDGIVYVKDDKVIGYMKSPIAQFQFIGAKLINHLGFNLAYIGQPQDYISLSSLISPLHTTRNSNLITPSGYVFVLDNKVIKKIKSRLLIENTASRSLLYKRAKALFKRENEIIFNKNSLLDNVAKVDN